MLFEPIFPGMDPFIEDQRWSEFHNLMIGRIHNELSRLLVPQYAVIAEDYIQLNLRPDVSIIRGRPNSEPLEHSFASIDSATRVITPTISEVEEQPSIEIRDENGVLVTAIEILSPANKVRHRDRYLAKRDAFLSSDSHLIEIDLLRGGKRLEPDVPTEDYVILVARSQADHPHQGELYEIGLRALLPIIPVPLKPDDPDVPLNLRALFRDVYIGARYRLQLDYGQMPSIPFRSDDQTWVDAILGRNSG